MRFPPEHPVNSAYGEVEQAVDARASYLIGLVDRLGEGETMTEGEDTYDDELPKEGRVAFGKCRQRGEGRGGPKRRFRPIRLDGHGATFSGGGTRDGAPPAEARALRRPVATTTYSRSRPPATVIRSGAAEEVNRAAVASAGHWGPSCPCARSRGRRAGGFPGP